MARVKAVAVLNKEVSRVLFETQVGGLSARLLDLRQWTVKSMNFPVLDVAFAADGRTPLRVRLLCDDWNDRPPSVQLLSPDGDPLTQVARDPAGIFNNSAHPVTGRPFICTPGSREYHTHTSHTADH